MKEKFNDFDLKYNTLIGEKIYKVWLQGREVYGEVYRILKQSGENYIVKNRKNEIKEMNLNCPDVIFDRYEAINQFYFLKNLKESFFKKKVELNDEVEIVFDDIEHRTIKIIPVYIKHKPTWTGKRNERLGSEEIIIDNSDWSKNIVSDRTPLGEMLLGKCKYERIFYSVNDNWYTATIINIFKNTKELSL